MTDFSTIEVAATLITSGDKFLLIFNPSWSTFTLPMTKRRVWQDPNIPPAHREEPWEDAAARAACEWLAHTSTAAPEYVCKVSGYAQSDSDGKWKRYNFQVFRLPVTQANAFRPGALAEWLTADEILDRHRRPISQTARDLIAVVTSLRQSVASLALITRDANGRTEYLAQWNPRWQRFHFVGGHKRNAESFLDCLVRELSEELNLDRPADYQVANDPPTHLEYTAFSESTFTETAYTLEVFRVTLSPAAALKVLDDDRNCWLTCEEITTGKTTDGRPVSQTMQQVLQKLGS